MDLLFSDTDRLIISALIAFKTDDFLKCNFSTSKSSDDM